MQPRPHLRPPAPPAATVPQAPIQGPEAETQLAETVQVVAVQARQTGTPASDPSLKPFQAALKKLPYDTFDLIYQHEQSAQYGAPSIFPLNDTYTAIATLKGSSSQGQVEIELSVKVKQEQQELDALRATGTIPRGQPVILRGMELPEGELIVLLTVKQPEQDKQQQDKQQQQQQQDEQQQQQNEQQQQQNEQEQQNQDKPQKPDKDQNNQQQMAQNQPEQQQEDQQSQQMKEPSQEQMQNIEAILESLRETDRKEQKNQVQDKRQRVVVSGDWW